MGTGQPQHRPPLPTLRRQAGRRHTAPAPSWGLAPSLSPNMAPSGGWRSPRCSGVPRPASRQGGLHGPASPARHRIPATDLCFCLSRSPRAPPVVCLLISLPRSGGAGLRARGFRAAPLTQKRTVPDVNPASFVIGDCATGKAQLSLAFALGCSWGRGVGAPLYCLLPPTLEMSFFFLSSNFSIKLPMSELDAY